MSYRFADEAEGIFSTEINLAMPSCDGWGGRYIYQDQIPCGFGQLLELSAMTDITLDDDELAGSIELKVSSPVIKRATLLFSIAVGRGLRKNHAGCDIETGVAGDGWGSVYFIGH